MRPGPPRGFRAVVQRRVVDSSLALVTCLPLNLAAEQAQAAGSMLAAPVEAFMSAADDAARGGLLTTLFTPTDTCSLEASTETKN